MRDAPAGARGGEVIQAPRPTRTRLITGIASVATASGIAAYTLSTGGVLARAGAVVAALGLATLAAGIVLRLPATIPWAVLLVGAGYLTARERHASADGDLRVTVAL